VLVQRVPSLVTSCIPIPVDTLNNNLTQIHSPLFFGFVAAEGSQPGDLVHLDGCSPPASYPKVLKLDEWRKVVPGLVVAAGGKVSF
jgi:hypothetical protein